MRQLRVLALLLVLTSSCNTGDDEVVTIDGGAAGTTVTVDEGQTLRVELEGNPTTGFEWEVSAVDEGVLRLAGRYFGADSDAEGSGGIVTLDFETAGPGATLLELIYRPPSEPPDASHQRFSVTVRVN